MRWSQPLARRDKLLCDLRLSGSNRRFEFQKRAQLFIHTHDETFSAAAMRVCNGRLFARGINRCDAAATPTGFAEIVCDDSQSFTPKVS